MLIVTIVEIHKLILDVGMIFQCLAFSADLLLKVFQINLKTVETSLIFYVSIKLSIKPINDNALNDFRYKSH